MVLFLIGATCKARHLLKGRRLLEGTRLGIIFFLRGGGVDYASDYYGLSGRQEVIILRDAGFLVTSFQS